jgi:hypothetical protein
MTGVTGQPIAEFGGAAAGHRRFRRVRPLRSARRDRWMPDFGRYAATARRGLAWLGAGAGTLALLAAIAFASGADSRSVLTVLALAVPPLVPIGMLWYGRSPRSPDFRD